MRKSKKAGIVLQLLAALLTLVLLFSVIQIVRHTHSEPAEGQVPPSKTVVYNDTAYFPRQDIDVLLVMGIDKYGPVEASDAYNNDGEADAILLLVFDHAEECVRVLNIDRDAMVEMPVLGIGGKQAGSAYGQIALSHTYGSGLEDSCENTRSAVCALLPGVSVDYYVAMHMDAIGILNDAVGGVRVEVKDDFSAHGAGIPMGQTTLHGQQAIDFVRYRENVGDQLNASRMQRQAEFVKNFLPALREKLEQDSNFVLQTYEKASAYIVTDCSATVLSSMLERYGEYTLERVETLPGESRKGEKHMEFYPDAEALQELVLDLFYAPK